MKSPVANCSYMDATSTFLVVLIYNLPQTKSVKNENVKRAHYQIISYVNDECVPAINIMVGNRMDSCLNLSCSIIQGTKLAPEEIKEMVR